MTSSIDRSPAVDTSRAVPAQRSLSALDTISVRLAGVCTAAQVCPRIGSRRYLHAGPPIDLADIPGPMRGALIGGLLLEGEAANAAEAEEIIDAGEVTITPCHDAGAVGAMAGIITPSMPVVVAETEHGHRTFSPLNEGTQGAVRYGSYDEATIKRLHWMGQHMAPVLDEVIRTSDPIDLFSLVAEGLRRGDDCHNRLVATTAAFLVWATPGLLRSNSSRDDVTRVATTIAANGHFALPFTISAAKAAADSAHGVPGSPVVTAMAANGQRFGIRVSGLGDRWFTTASPVGQPVLLDGATMADVNPTMGDSMIAETAGFGAFAMTAAPAITSFVGGNLAQAHKIVADMRTVTTGTSTRLLIPAEDFAGTPLGIDVTRVAARSTEVLINNGLTHREAGRGRVGAGITPIPIEPFAAAAAALAADRPA